MDRRKRKPSKKVMLRKTKRAGSPKTTTARALFTIQPASGAMAASSTLPFSIQRQSQSNWCWAAVSTSVALFYSQVPAWTQCMVASQELNQPCCANAGSAGCNIPWYLDRALARVNHFAAPISASPMTFAQVQNEIASGRPVGVRVAWSTGGAHFLTIYGYTSTQMLNVADPIFGTATIPYSTFLTRYQNTGTWTHTYRTQ